MTAADRVLVVSPQKTGTHLVQELMLELDYKIVGATRPSERNTPVFDAAQRKRIARLVHDDRHYAEILDLEGTDEFTVRTDRAWQALCWSWYLRFGQPVVNRYGNDKAALVANTATNPDLGTAEFDQTPPGLCWMWHDLDISAVDGAFVGSWSETGAPPVILNYRDPRDALVSLINFVEGRTSQGFGNFYERRVFSAILKSKPTMHEKIDYALRDPYFTAATEFEKAIWLLHHPRVCKVRYEDLIGPSGGGDRKEQVKAVERILEHLGAQDRDAGEIADRIYNPDSWSFHRGRTGDWKEAFSEDNLARFKERYGEVLEQYGYE